MTAPARPLSGFIEKLLSIKQLQLQQQAQRLRERSEGAATVDLFRRLVAASPNESRPALVQLFAEQTGMSPDLLTGAAGGPESIELVKSRKTAGGAAAIPDTAVASVGLTGQLPGAVQMDQDFAAMMESATPEQRQTYFNQAMARLPVPNAMLGQASAVAGGLEPSAGDQLQADVSVSGMKSQQVIAAGQQATQLALGQLEAYSRALGAGGGGAGGQMDAAKIAVDAMNKLNSPGGGGLDKTSQAIYLQIVRDMLAQLGHDPYKLIPPGTTVDPTVLQNLSKKIPWLKFGVKGFEGLPQPGSSGVAP